ncbi:MAG TPA: c-type cytochrome [Vicinamibacterales bacterium]|jgi:hypothetical protein
MRNARSFIFGTAVLALTFAGPGLLAAGQTPPAPKNVQVLTGMSLKDIRADMQIVSQSLGVQCTFCHVAGNFASDEKPQKATARKMMTMVKDINAKYFPRRNGAETANADPIKGRVSCYTCHNGATEPKRLPPSAAPGM